MPQLDDFYETAPVGEELDAALLKSGDLQATEAALLALVPLVRKWLYRLLGPNDLLDDATQEALTEICGALPRFKGLSALTTFAHRITVRCAYRYFSKATVVQAVDSIEETSAAGDNPESSAANRQLLRRIYRYLDMLPKKQRTAFVLCAVEGLSPTQAAHIVGTLPVTMRSRLKRARGEILRRMDADETVRSAVAKWRSE